MDARTRINVTSYAHRQSYPLQTLHRIFLLPANHPLSCLCSKCPYVMSVGVQFKLECVDKILVKHASARVYRTGLDSSPAVTCEQ